MKWVLAECDQNLAAALAAGSGLHPLIAKLMVNRGITDPAAARVFLDCDLSLLSSPMIFAGMEPAVHRISKALSSHEKIVIYGDYDVDGVTGSALLYLVLRSLGADVHHYIPDRLSEGYGLNAAAVHSLKASGTRLVVTVDCGISALPEAAAARSVGLDLIITDHHEIAHQRSGSGSASLSTLRVLPAEHILPDALAILHPGLLLPGVPDSIRDQVQGLTGVGVAFKLAQALLQLEASDELLKRYLDLVTLGTVADVGRIMGENRVLVKHGLERLSLQSEARPGIAGLKRVAGLDGKRITAGNVGFNLAPRINASGRLERADIAFRLLITDSLEEANSLASTLDSINRERQGVEELIHQEARSLCRGQDLATTGAFVLSSPEWHPGVIGIVASRVVEEFHRPTALISVTDGIGKGSARSIPGFDLYKGLLECSDLLLGFGGHKYAAGFSIASERIPEFRQRLSSAVMNSLGKEGFVRTLLVDASIPVDELNLDLVRDIETLSPFGMGNPEPRLGTRGLSVLSSRIVGNNHLKLRLRHGSGIILDAIAFNRGDLQGKKVRDGVRVAVVFTPRVNAWNGSAALELEIRDIKLDN